MRVRYVTSVEKYREGSESSLSIIGSDINIICLDTNGIDRTFKNALYIPKEGESVFFDKYACFPKYKIPSTYKRTIKLEKADFVVVPELGTFTPEEGILFSWTELGRFDKKEHPRTAFMENSYIQLFLDHTLDSTKDDFIAWLAKHLKDFKLLRDGIVTRCSASDEPLINSLIDGTYTKIISDVNFGKIACAALPEFTLKEFESIWDMVQSTDAATRELGYKCLEGYNINDYKMAVKLLMCNPCQPILPTNTGIKHLKKFVDFDKRDNKYFSNTAALWDYDIKNIPASNKQMIIYLLDKLADLYPKTRMGRWSSRGIVINNNNYFKQLGILK